jgi:hypothetical protein
MCTTKAFEVSSPLTGLLRGEIDAYVTEVGGVAPATLIRTDELLEIHVEWSLEGQLTEYICGAWCVRVVAESIGPGPEVQFPEPAMMVPLTSAPESTKYQATLRIPASTFQPQTCVAVFKLVVVVAYRTPQGLPGPMAGFVELRLQAIYEP